jgi:hypothetical protein
MGSDSENARNEQSNTQTNSKKALAVLVLPGLVFPGTGAFLVAQERSSAQT